MSRHHVTDFQLNVFQITMFRTEEEKRSKIQLQQSLTSIESDALSSSQTISQIEQIVIALCTTMFLADMLLFARDECRIRWMRLNKTAANDKANSGLVITRNYRIIIQSAAYVAQARPLDPRGAPRPRGPPRPRPPRPPRAPRLAPED